MKRILSIFLVLGMFQYAVKGQEEEEEDFWERPDDGPLPMPPKDFCKYNGDTYQLGETYVDSENCKICECCNSGDFKCKKKVCAVDPPPCGVDHYDWDNDPCCPVCDAECQATSCPPVQCAGPKVYAPEACCPSCGCEWRGADVMPGGITDKPTAACEQCTCYTTGNVSCNYEAACPESRLQCVDPEVRDDENDCNWHCPNGKTCKRFDETILPGEYEVVKEVEVCFCIDWHPLAFCGHVQHWGKIENALHDDRCMSRPPAISTWNDES